VNEARATFRLQKALARALTAPDPALAVRRAARDRRHPAHLRRALRAARGTGVEIAALLVARLRFERLVRGCPEAEAWFEREPAGFASAFRRYHAEVAPTAFFPSDEARLFQAWQSRRPAHDDAFPR
jgi:hypothetical protein